MRDMPNNGGESKPRLWWWKEWQEQGGKYLVGLVNIQARDWDQLGGLQHAVVDDFGNLVAVPA